MQLRPYHNVKMINSIVGVQTVEEATAEQLERIGYLERKNAFYLEEGITNHQERKEKLQSAYFRKYVGRDTSLQPYGTDNL